MLPRESGCAMIRYRLRLSMKTNLADDATGVRRWTMNFATR